MSENLIHLAGPEEFPACGARDGHIMVSNTDRKRITCSACKLEGEPTPRPEYRPHPAITAQDRITSTTAPSIDGVYPAKQPAKAVWAALWRLLSEAKAPMEVGALAAVVSALVPSYSPVSVRAMLDKAVRDGLLERTGGRPQAVKIRDGVR